MIIPNCVKNVAPSDVSSEFEKMRRAQSLDPSIKNPGSVVRATLANVIFLAGKTELDPLLTKLARSLPSRFFAIQINEKACKPVDINVGGRTLENSSGQVLQTEEVYITVSPSAIQRVPNIILSQLVPDIDVVAIECEGFDEQSHSKELKELITSISDIYVSEDSTQVASENNGKNINCAFRSWSLPLISKWCSVVSEQFDSDYVIGSLKELKEISIDFSAHKLVLNKSKYDPSELTSLVPSDVSSFTNWIVKSLKLKINEILNEGNDTLLLFCEPEANDFLSSPLIIKVVSKNAPHVGSSAHITGVKFIMGDEDNRFYVSCSYLNSLGVVEVSSGGSLKAVGCSADSCEFNIRRIPAKTLDQSEAILIAIRNQPCNCSVS